MIARANRKRNPSSGLSTEGRAAALPDNGIGKRKPASSPKQQTAEDADLSK